MGIWTRILKEHLINKEKKFKYFGENIHEKSLRPTEKYSLKHKNPLELVEFTLLTRKIKGQALMAAE